MGQELNGSLGSWVTLSDPFTALPVSASLPIRLTEKSCGVTKNHATMFTPQLQSFQSFWRGKSVVVWTLSITRHNFYKSRGVVLTSHATTPLSQMNWKKTGAYGPP